MNKSMNIRRVKLYHFPMSRSARVKWLLHELLDNDFDVELVALYQGQQYDPQYLKRNPNHAVPLLEITHDDDSVFTMIESGAMITLLADAYPDKRIAPPAGAYSVARADYLQMLHFGASWMDMMLWQLRLQCDLLPEKDRDPRTVERFSKKFAREVEPQLAARFEKQRFVCGDSFTAADCVIGHNILWARMYGLCADTVFSRYLDAVSLRPAHRAAFADRDQFTRTPG